MPVHSAAAQALIRRARSYERLVALGLEIRVARAAGGFQVQLEVLWLLSSTVAAAQATQPEAQLAAEPGPGRVQLQVH